MYVCVFSELILDDDTEIAVAGFGVYGMSEVQTKSRIVGEKKKAGTVADKDKEKEIFDYKVWSWALPSFLAVCIGDT